MTAEERTAIETLTETLARGLGEIVGVLALDPEPEAVLAEGSDSTAELEAAKQMLRIDVAKRVLPTLIATTAGRGVNTERLVDSAFQAADIFVARAFATAAPVVEANTEESTS